MVGAGGFLGRPIVRAFSRAGFEVRGLVRDAIKGTRVREDGGTPRMGDILDVRSIRAAAAGCVGIVHVAANPPDTEDTARVRVEGARNIVAAARAEGVPRVLVGSGYWVYRGQPELIHEDSPVRPAGESQVNYDAERAGLEANSPGQLDVMVVRPGMVYGNGSWFRELAASIRAGEYRVVGPGANRWSFVDREDAGTAFRTVLESGRAGEAYNVVDGHPESLRGFADYLSAELHAPPVPTISLDEAEREMGAVVARHLAADRPTSNRKISELGWSPQFPDIRVGIPRLLPEMFPG